MSTRKFQCQVCAHIHDETQGARWEDLPDDWVCPECGASKQEFRELECASS